MNTGRLPQLPIQFSYRVEVISEIVNFVTTYDVSEYKSLKLKKGPRKSDTDSDMQTSVSHACI